VPGGERGNQPAIARPAGIDDPAPPEQAQQNPPDNPAEDDHGAL
jgi:hypothetical protein